MTISRMQQPRQMYQEGGIMPRLNQLGSGVSSAEQMLQGINQRLESAESTLGEGGFQPTQMPIGSPMETFSQIPEQFKKGFSEYMKGKPMPLGGQAISSVGLPGGGSVTFGDTGSAGAFRDYLKSTGFNPPNPRVAQLPGLGGGMGSPIQQAMMGRQNYGLGSLVKSITKPIKSVLKSDLGKAAILGIGAFGLPTAAGQKIFSGFAPQFLKTAATGLMDSKVGGVLKDVFTGSLVGGGLDYLQRSQLPNPEEKISGRSREEIDEVVSGLKQNYKNLGYEEGEIDLLVEQYINQNYPGYYRAEGGRIGYARGDTAEQNAMQAAGIMDLPLNQNPAGVTELDLRETGGFIPPVGVKEKADDIPAMLSNNEFVFTADAVRGMGDGDVNRGAERMYSMMKQLENGGRV